MIVRASDGALPFLTTDVNVSVSVTPVNDFAPVFAHGTGVLFVSVSEEVTVGATVAQLSVLDNDCSGNATIT